MHRITGVLIIALLGSLYGCAGSIKHPTGKQNFTPLDNTAQNIDSVKPIRVKAPANTPWQNTHVFLENGDTVTVVSKGKWSVWPEMAMWCGPDGNPLYLKPEFSGIPGGALMGKIGFQGLPFRLGSTRSFHVKDYGMLYVAINDNFANLYDNEGELNVDVYIDRNEQHRQPGTGNTTITGYEYDDKTRKGSISARLDKNQFSTRQWLLTKIGEIASTRNVAIEAGNTPTTGGSYTLLDEKVANGVLTINFETVY